MLWSRVWIGWNQVIRVTQQIWVEEDQISKQPVQLEKLYFDSDDSDAVAEDETLPNLPDGFHEVNLNDSEYE